MARLDVLTANDRAGEYPRSWYAETAAPLPLFPPAAGEMRAEVCIVGAGFTGLSAALHLARRGYDVILLDAHRVGWGASGRNGGQVGTGQRLGQEELERLVGPDHARALWDLAQEAVALTKALAAEHAPEAGWAPGIIHACHRPRLVPHAHAYAEKMARDYGYDLIRPLGRAFMADPKLVLLDEPAAGVNPTLMNAIADRIRALNARGMTIFLIEHNMPLVMSLCDPILVMANGKLLLEGDAARVRSDRRVIEAYLGGEAAHV